ncbi:MAG: cobalamin B12-binding domain-containing protein [Candidatus Methylomirabilales bacterium]
MGKRIRVLMAKCGLDGHDRGVKVIARALRDAGMEVVYTGLHQTPEQVVQAAIEEDVDVIGVSLLSGAHMTIFPRILELLKEKGAAEIPLLGGGTIIDPEEIEALKGMGVAAILGPDTPIDEVVACFREAVGRRAAAKSSGGEG